MVTLKATVLALLPVLASAIDAPNYQGWRKVWEDGFLGYQGEMPDGNTWNVMDAGRVTNNEMQTYKALQSTTQRSGGKSLQLVPWKEGNNWISARIERRGTLTPAAGKVTRVEASIRVGGNSNKQGIWPAFWMLGDAMRNGLDWPECGEIDIMEQVNGEAKGHGGVHCGNSGPGLGGPCDEPNGKVTPVDLPDRGVNFHTWRVEISRQSDDWKGQYIRWFLDDREFRTIYGGEINDFKAWQNLAHKPLYIILNVAVGGNWPGSPNGATQGGYGSMMEVRWVAHYVSN